MENSALLNTISSTSVPSALKDISKNRLRRNQSTVWKFAQKLDLTRCKCNFCGKILKTRNYCTTHILNHLLKEHMDETEVARDIPVEKSLKGKKKKKSLVWKYSKEKGRDQTICLLCNKTVSSPNGTITGVRKHLITWHSDNLQVMMDF